MAVLTSLTQARSFGASPVDGGLGRAKEVGHRDAGNLDRVLHRQEQPGPGPLVDLHGQDVLAVEGDCAAGDGVLRVPGDRVGQRGLARSVRPHDRVNLAGSDGEVDTAEDLLGAGLGLDRDVQIADLERAHGCRCLTKSVAVHRVDDVDEHVVAVDLDRIHGDGLGGRQAGGLPGAQVEARAVLPALDLAVVDLAFGQRDLFVRAGVADCVDLAVHADQSHVDADDGGAHRASVEHVGDGTRQGVAAHTEASLCASSRSTAAQQPVGELGHADLVDQRREEPAHDQPSGLVLGNPARLQVEQLLVVEATGGAGVAGAHDLAGLDLEVGYGVGPRTVGEHEVAVELVGGDALSLGPDEDVADPHRVGVLALQGALVGDVAVGLRGVVVDEQAVLDVLAGVDEVQPEQLGVASRAGVVERRSGPDEVAAEGDHDVLHRGVAPDPDVVVREVDGVVCPLLQRDEGEVGAVVDDDLDVVDERGRPLVLEHDHARAVRVRRDDDVPCGGLLGRQAPQPDDGGLRCGDLAGHGDGQHLVGLGPGPGADPVVRDITGRAAQGVVGLAGLDPHLRVGVDADLVVVTVECGVDVQPAQPDHRGEPPGLLAPVRHLVGIDVEGGEPVQGASAMPGRRDHCLCRGSARRARAE